MRLTLERWRIARETERLRDELCQIRHDKSSLTPLEEFDLRDRIAKGDQRLGHFDRAAGELEELAQFASQFPKLKPFVITARLHHLGALMLAGAHEAGLASAEALIAELSGTPKSAVSYSYGWRDQDRAPVRRAARRAEEDVLACAYAGRWTALEQLRRHDEAQAAAGVLISRYRTGTTDMQQRLVVQALVAQARIAKLTGDRDQGLIALDEAIATAQRLDRDAEAQESVKEAMAIKTALLRETG